MEDIFFFKGRNISNYNQKKKLNYIADSFQNYLNPIAILKNDIVFGLPIFSNNEKDFLNIPYDLYCIQYRNLNIP